MIMDRSFSDQMQEVLDPSFFEKNYGKRIIKYLFEYKDKYRRHPSVDNLRAYVANEESSDAEKKELEEFLVRFAVPDNDFDQKQFVTETALEFCKKMKLADALMKSIHHLEEHKYDSIKGEIEAALKLGADKNYGLDYKIDFDVRYTNQYRKCVPTGWTVINELTCGGLASGELGLIVAPSGVGKSFALSNVGAAALREGKTVVYYTLELSEGLIARRFDSNLSGIPLNDLDTNLEEVKEAVEGCPGRLFIKEYPTKSVGLTAISIHLEKLIMAGTKPDMIIVDYVDLLKSPSHYDEKRFELESTYEGLRGLAKQYTVPVWTASQTNRNGSKQEWIDNDSIAESYSKIFVADFVMTISRSSTDVAANLARVFIAKNRMGKDKIKFPVIMDNARGIMDILISDQEIENYKKQEKASHNKNLIEKLKSMKSK